MVLHRFTAHRLISGLILQIRKPIKVVILVVFLCAELFLMARLFIKVFYLVEAKQMTHFHRHMHGPSLSHSTGASHHQQMMSSIENHTACDSKVVGNFTSSVSARVIQNPFSLLSQSSRHHYRSTPAYPKLLDP